MGPKVERLENIPVTQLGEGPHWDVESQSLYFVDIPGKAIHKYVPATKKHTMAVIGTDSVSLIIPVEGKKDQFLISIGRKLAIITWDGESKQVSDTQYILEVENEPLTINNRFNDGKCDPSGRLWAGTMGALPRQESNRGALYSFQNNKLVKHLSNIGISNGLAWSEDTKTMYYIDSVPACVESYDYDIINGTIKKKEVVFSKEQSNTNGGHPDGMAIDKDGNLWVALFNGHGITKVDPRTPETVLDFIPIPAKQATSVAFGGPNIDELYVTTARINVDDAPGHGGTYRITGINAQGYPGVSVKL